MTTPLPYGAWPSPLSARDVAAGTHPIDGAAFVGDDVWWLERLPEEGGRTSVFRRGADGPVRLLPAPWDVRSRVHEYGGGAWVVLDDGSLVFVEKTDQRVWRSSPDSPAPRALTPDDGESRFGDLTVSHGRLYAVRERHTPGGAAREVVEISLLGDAAVTVIAEGSDFVAYPRVSPEGTRIAWIAWDHPAMPWDATRLMVADLEDGGAAGARTILGTQEESVLQPEWLDEDTLLAVTDRSGRWNLVRADVPSGGIREIAPADADTGGPLWNLGLRWFARVPGGLVAVRTHGTDRLVALSDEGTISELSSPLSSRVLIQDARGSRLLVTGAGAATAAGLWIVDASGAAPSLIRSSVDVELDPEWLPAPEQVTYPGPRGDVHAVLYPPRNPDIAEPADERPPYLVLAHGGPTAHVAGEATPGIAYFTSRGIGVLDVNYGGSTGYGRAYRERLRGAWGTVDRDDVVAAASGLADSGRADPARLAIRGSSAGGWTVLRALTATNRFAAGISRYGVADLRALVEHTHDFEARYLDGLVGPWPEAAQLYADLSPLAHLERFTTPMLLEQGLDDRVVPPAQSELVRDALAARGIPHAYLEFEGEGHGFRAADTLVRALEAEMSFLGQVLGFDPPGIPVLALSEPPA